MPGAYCNYCDRRCFVERVIPGGPERGRSFHLATCQGGMAHDLEVTGYTHETAINPGTDPGAAAACREPGGEAALPDFGGWPPGLLAAQKRHRESLLAVSAGQSGPERPRLRAEHAAVCAEIARREA